MLKVRRPMILLALLAALPLSSPARGAADAPAPPAPAKGEGPTYQVPYRLTNVLHVLVRVKINGKGPFNFILDTGAPVVFVTREVGKKIGLAADKKGWTILERLDVEGGVTQAKVKARLETPFQLEGMNTMGLAGAQIHGILGYTFLAHFRLGFDFTRDQLTWTKLTFNPPPPQAMGKKGVTPPDLGYVATLMKVVSFLVGQPPVQEVTPRGYLGIELAEADGRVTVQAVQAGSPAASAGLKAGDRVQLVQGKAIASAADAHRWTARVAAGQPVRLTIRRGEKTQEITVTAGEGL